MATKDVELRIRARDQASKQLSDIEKAIKSFSDSQKLAAQASKDSGGLIAAFGAELGKVASDLKKLSELQTATQGLVELDNRLGQTASAVKDTRVEIAELEKTVKTFQSSLKKGNVEATTNERAIAKQATANTKLKEQLKLVGVEARQAQVEFNRLNKALVAKSPKERPTGNQVKEQQQVVASLVAQQKNLDAELQKGLARERALKLERRELTNETSRLQKETDRFTKQLQNANDRLSRQVGTSVQLKNEKRELQTASAQLNQSLGAELKTLEDIDAAQKRSLATGQRLKQGLAQDTGRRAAPAAASDDPSARLARVTKETREAKLATEDFLRVQSQSRTVNADLNRLTAESAALFRQKRNELFQIKAAPFIALRDAIRASSVEIEANTARIRTLSATVAGGGLGAREAKAEILSLAGANRELEQRLLGLRSRYNDLKPAQAQLLQQFRALNVELPRTAISTASAREAITRLGERTREAVGPLRLFREVLVGSGAAALSLSGQTAPLGAVLRGLRSQVTVTASAFLGFFAIFRQTSEVIAAFRQLEAAQNRLGVVFQGDEFAAKQEFRILRSESQRLGVELGTLADEYSKFAVAGQQANISLSVTRDLFLAVTEAGRVNKLSNEQLGGTFLALTQIISKGKIQAEEITRQLGDRLPGAIGIFASALTDGDIPRFFEELQSGSLRPTEENLIKIAAAFRGAFGSQLEKSLQTTTTEIGKFENQLTIARQTIAQSGFIEAFTRSLRGINEALSSSEGENFFITVGLAAGSVVDTFRSLAENSDLIIGVLRTLLTLKAAQYFIGLRNSLLAYQVQLGATNKFAAFFLQLKASEIPAAIAGRFSASMRLASGLMKELAVSTRAASFSLGTIKASARGAQLAVVGLATRGIALLGGALFALAGGPLGLLIIGLEVLSNVFFDTSLLGAIGSFFFAFDEGAQQIVKAESALIKITDALVQNQNNLSAAQKQIQENVDFSSLEAQVQSVNQQYQEQLELIEQLANPLSTLSADRLTAGVSPAAAEQLARTRQTLDELIVSFKNGNISAKDFQTRTTELVTSLRETGTATQDVQLNILAYAQQLILAQDELKNLERQQRSYQDAVNFSLTGDEVSGRRLLNLEQEATQQVDINKLKGEAAELEKEFLADRVAVREIDQQIARTYEQINSLLAEDGTLSAENVELAQTLDDILVAQLKTRDEISVASQTLNSQNETLEELQIRTNALLITDKNTREQSVAIQLALNKATRDGVTDLEELQKIRDNAAKIVGLQQGLAASNRPARVGRSGGGGRTTPVKTEEQKQAEKQAKFNEDFARKAIEQQEELRISTIDDARLQEVTRARQQAVNDARRQGVEISKEQLDLAVSIAGAKFDQLNPSREMKTLEAAINKDLQFRNSIITRIDSLRRRGDGEAVNQADELEQTVTRINDRLREKIQNALTLARAMGDVQKAADLEVQLDSIDQRLEDLGGLSARALNQLFAGQATQAVDTFFTKLGEGESVINSLGEALRSLFADLFKQLAQLLLNEAFLSLFGAGRGGRDGGIGSFLSSFATDLFRLHSGGVVTGRGQATSASAFLGAKRFHDGGFPGLKRDEVPAILQTGEEVLARNDPRNAMNGAGRGMDVKVINTIDPSSFISEGLSTPIGQKAVLNYISGNKTAVRGVLGI